MVDVLALVIDPLQPVSASRMIALDAFRGLAMLMIVLDHIGGSVLSRVTLHVFAFPDAAEAFVFLSGFALTSAWVAWVQHQTRQDAPRARVRLLQRVWPIYRGFLLCSALMLSIGATFQALHINGPNLPVEALTWLREAPLRYLLDLLLLRHQPYLASVLPMYLLFVLAAPLAIPYAWRHPLITFALSTMLWTMAPGTLTWWPTADGAEWTFNPLAWQWMFMLGVLARGQQVQRAFSVPFLRRGVGAVALTVVLACAFWRLWIETGYLDPALKQNLDLLRVMNFVALAWVSAMAARSALGGWIIRRAPWVARVGRHSLACFIAGAGLSLVLDTLLNRATDGELDYPAGLLTDFVALAAMFVLAAGAERIKRRLAALKKTKARTESPGFEAQ